MAGMEVKYNLKTVDQFFSILLSCVLKNCAEILIMVSSSFENSFDIFL